MIQPERDTKEIRLFGKKSIREEAYLQKILQLEKEVVNLGSALKDSDSPASENASLPQHLDGLYYESLISFDKKVKKEQEFLEKRANEIVERLDLQAQKLILNIESSSRRKTRWLIFSIASAGVFLFIAFSGVILLLRSNITGIYNVYPPEGANHTQNTKASGDRASYIKTAIETQTKYHHQYSVTRLKLSDGIYAADIELNSPPESKLSLKDFSLEVAGVFQRYAVGIPAEFSFFHKGKLYIKAYLTEPPQKLRLQYFY